MRFWVRCAPPRRWSRMKSRWVCARGCVAHIGQFELVGHCVFSAARPFAGWGLNLLSWNWLPLLPMLGVFFISGIAETARHPFDVVEGESEIVAGHMVDYSGMAFALFFLAEYINMIV